AEDGIRDLIVTGVKTCALPICPRRAPRGAEHGGEIRRVVLPIAVERDDDRGAAAPRGGDARPDRLPLAEAPRMAENLGAGRARGRRASVVRAVVHDEHGRVRPRRGDDFADRLRLVEHRDDDYWSERREAATHCGWPDKGAAWLRTTIATWLPPRAIAWTSAGPREELSRADTATASAPRPE